MKRNCGKGLVAGIESLNPSCDCPPGIASISESQDGLDMIITLTDGSSYTLPLPVGQKGPPGDTGNTGAAGASGTSLLYNNFSDEATTGTNSYETLDTAPIAGNTLSADGDALHINGIFDCGIASVNTTFEQVAKLEFGGQILVGDFTFSNPSNQYNYYYVDVILTRLSNTTAKAITTINVYQNLFGGGITIVPQGVVIQTLTSLDFTILQNILAQGKVNGAGHAQVISDCLRVELLKKA